MDIFHAKECEICNLKIADADFMTHLKDCHEEKACGLSEGDVEHIKEDHMVITSEEGVPLSEAEKNYPSMMCIEEACDEVFAGEQEMKQHRRESFRTEQVPFFRRENVYDDDGGGRRQRWRGREGDRSP